MITAWAGRARGRPRPAAARWWQVARTVGAVRRPERPRLGRGRARRRLALVVVVEARCAGADCRGATDGDGILRHRPARQDEPGGARTRDVRFVKGGVARAGCRLSMPAGGTVRGRLTWPPSSSPTTAAAWRGRWRRVGEKIALEDDRLDAVIAKLLLHGRGISAVRWN